MKKLKKTLIVVFIAAILFLFNCIFKTNSDTSLDENDSSSGNSSSSATIETKPWVSINNIIQFYTNDSSKTTNAGATYWSPRSYKNAGLTNDVIEANVFKVSGLSSYGYGLAFCIQDNPSGGVFLAKNLYAVLITTEGYYQILKIIEDTNNVNAAPIQHQITNWIYSSYIMQGKNVPNKIKIEITDPEGNTYPNFTIYFNDHNIYTFEDSTQDVEGNPIKHFYKSDGAFKYGFILTLGPNENFPNVPVDVQFEQLTPDYSTGSINSSILFSIDNSNSTKSSIYMLNSSIR